MDHLVAFKSLIVLHPAQHGQIDGVLVLRSRSQRGGGDDLLGADPFDAEGLTQGQLVHGQGPGLIRAEDINPGQLFDGHQPADDGLFRRQQPGPHGHCHRQDRGHGHGDGRHRQNQGELESGHHPVAAEKGDRQNQDHQHQRQDDQVIADLQHRSLEMAGGVRLLDQLGGLAEVRVLPGGIDQAVNFSLMNNRPRVHCLAGFTGDGQRLTRQRRLVHFHRITIEQARIRRHDVPQAEADYVTRHQQPHLCGGPLPVTLHPGLDGQLGLQGLDGVSRLELLPETDRGVGQEQNQDDEKIRPVTDQGRENNRHLDHPRNRPPKISQEFQERIGLFLSYLVRAVLRQATFSLVLAETVRRRVQLFPQLRQGQGAQIVVHPGLRSRFRFPPFGLLCLGFHGGTLPFSAMRQAWPASGRRLPNQPCSTVQSWSSRTWARMQPAPYSDPASPLTHVTPQS